MDKKKVEFHISVNDYFGTLATVLSLYAQDLKAGRSGPEKIAQDLLTKSDELMYLQDQFRITRQV
jgi:hypothetical protein